MSLSDFQKEKNPKIVTSSYFVALLPYIGLIIDGVEDWLKAYNNSTKTKISVPLFTNKEQLYYEDMHNSIKMLEKGVEELYSEIKDEYEKSDEYFSSLCKPIAKKLHIYNIYGIFRCNSIPCDHSILDQCFIPFFKFGNINNEDIRQILEITGKYICCFNAYKKYTVNSQLIFDSKDYGGFLNLLFGNK